MLKPILGSRNAERVLIFVFSRGEGYAKEISDHFKTDLYGIQKQLDKFEIGGVMMSTKTGRTRVYRFNPRYHFLKELKALLEKALQFYPTDKREELSVYRKRPRRRSKPI